MKLLSSAQRKAVGIFALLLIIGVPVAMAAPGDPTKTIDIADLTAGIDPLFRAYGTGTPTIVPLGVAGVPVAGGFDIDGDGYVDTAVSHMLSSPAGRFFAGEVHVVFGDGSSSGAIDLAVLQNGFLRFIGAGTLGASEMAGSEIWMGDVTGDGVGDLLIARQNYSFQDVSGPRIGPGALSIIVGGPELRNLADSLVTVDLASPPPSLTIFTLVGAADFDRLGVWMRADDVDGDGIDDLVVAADQESDGTATHHGAVYVVRGGSHLAQSATVDLANYGSTILAGNIARVVPPAGSEDFHLGATCQLGDLDDNGRAEIFAGATVNRAGASVGPFGFGLPTTHGAGGAPAGRAYVLWDDAFPSGAWPAGFQIELESDPSVVTVIDGGVNNGSFGEELLGGLDYNGDGKAELFIGDLVGDASVAGDRPFSGIGYVFYKARRLKGKSFNIDNPPPGVKVTTILGPNDGAIGSDTVAQGDFNGDGLGDLMIGSPHAHPLERFNAGVMHVFFGRGGRWPELIDTAPGALPPKNKVRIVEILGALGRTDIDEGDTLCYSAAAGDVDGDGKTDIITNEMVGNGIGPQNLDAGNLIVLSGDFISPDDDDDDDSDSDSDSD